MTKVKAVYIGQRYLDHNDQLVSVFNVGKKRVVFASLARCVIGYAYFLIKEGKDHSIGRNPEMVGDDPAVDEEQRDEWQAEDLVARQKQKRERMRKRLRKKPELLRGLDVLKRATARLTFTEKRLLVEYIVDVLEGDIK